jgi:phosphoserine phosphatase RsbU/P
VIEDLLRQVPIFSSLPDYEYQYLAQSLASSQAEAGKILWEEGTVDERCILVVDGSVEVLKALGTPEERRLAVCEPGSLLGEMSLFNQEGAHTASVRALTPVSLMELTRADLNRLIQRQPDVAYAMIGLVSRRLAGSENDTIARLREKNKQLEQAYEDLKSAQARIIAQERLEHELDIARDIQQSFLPPELPRLPGFDFGALMIPARSVGGDLYDFIPLDEDRLGIVVGDVSDKGVPAALVMSLTYSLLRAEAFRGGTPGQVLRAVNRLMLDMNNLGMFVTVLYGVLDSTTSSFTYARAGHPYPVLLSPGGQLLPILESTGQPIGLLDAPAIDEGSFSLEEDSTLCLFTDALSEAQVGTRGEQLEREGVARALSGWRHEKAQEICERMWQMIRLPDPDHQPDDFTVVIVKKVRA